MKIDYLFSRNSLIGSRLICWGSAFLTEGLEKVPSHVAILLDDSFVIESTMTSGVRVIPYNKWLEINEELYKIPTENRTINDVKELLFEMWGKKYDKCGLFYFGWCVLKFMLFKDPIPCINRREREDYFFCTEFAGRLAGHNYSMTTPAMLCKRMLNG